MKCAAYCLAKTFQFKELIEYFTDHERTALYRDTLHIMKEEGDIVVFPYGVVITWGISHDDTKRLFDQLRPFAEGPHPSPFMDEFSFSLGNETVKIHTDHIYLAGGDAFEIISISHGIAQSCQASRAGQYVQESIDSTSHIPQTIARKGRTTMNRKEIARMRGGLFLVEADINMNFELLDTPEFFWEFPEYEDRYYAVSKYLDTRPRVDLLTKKLSVIHNLLIMLADEQNHKHSATLEWIIIWLIAIEIIIFIFQDIAGKLK
jgi:uncharacterized Rmd1/YagE family protein